MKEYFVVIVEAEGPVGKASATSIRAAAARRKLAQFKTLRAKRAQKINDIVRKSKVAAKKMSSESGKPFRDALKGILNQHPEFKTAVSQYKGYESKLQTYVKQYEKLVKGTTEKITPHIKYFEKIGPKIKAGAKPMLVNIAKKLAKAG